MSIKISFSQARDLAEMAVAEKGEDYIYQRPYFEDAGRTRCAYYNELGEPSCLVGHILYRMGVFFSPVGLGDGEQPNRMGVGALINAEIIDIDEATLEFLITLQANQDCGTPWGECLHRGLAAVATHEAHKAAIRKEKING